MVSLGCAASPHRASITTMTRVPTTNAWAVAGYAWAFHSACFMVAGALWTSVLGKNRPATIDAQLRGQPATDHWNSFDRTARQA